MSGSPGARDREYPGVVFRDGPSGLRAVVVGGPDVWEVARAVRDVRRSEKSFSLEDCIELVMSQTGITEEQALAAMSYYRMHPGEITAELARADCAETTSRN